MAEFEIQRNTRKCASTGRELKPGEWCISALVDEPGGTYRKDFATEAWQTPPEGTIGWWKCKIEEPAAAKQKWAPSDVMVSYFNQLENDPSREDVRFILALLMVRRRIARVESTETAKDGSELMTLHVSKTDSTHQVRGVLPSDERAREIQKQLSSLLQTPAGHAAAAEARAQQARAEQESSEVDSETAIETTASEKS